jgi:hypothetical protein
MTFGLGNREYYDPTNANSSLKDSPMFILRLMALDQSLIGRSRIAWEKLMRFVYFMETGNQDLAARQGGRTRLASSHGLTSSRSGAGWARTNLS